MDWVILDGFESSDDAVGSLLRSRLDDSGKSYAYFRLKDMQILPCRSCGACGYKSPGKCVVNDDVHVLMRAVAPCSVLVLLSPLRFGGYASRLKMAVEKFMNLGMPYYTVRKGFLLHRMRYPEKSLLTVGVKETEVTGQEDAFRRLGRRNARNILSRHHRSVVMGAVQETEELNRVLEEALLW